MPPATESIKVIVRVRPINQKEINLGAKRIVEVDQQNNQIYFNKPEGKEVPKTFAFDAVYGEDSKQLEVYDESAFPLVEAVLEGYNGTIFAYGQTGCGKTHTMVGLKEPEEQKGIIPNTFKHIFGFIDGDTQEKKYYVSCSFLEIYNEELHDLLGDDIGKKLDLKESPDKGTYVKDLKAVVVKSVAEIEKALVMGNKNRRIGETAMNKESSRSHSIFTIYIESGVEKKDGSGQKIKAGKLNLVDLAGSEKQSKTQATGERLKEATKINLSLSALGNVISALVNGKNTHVPFRDSKLTRLLQDSLGGNTKTVMIAALSPVDYNYDETLSTLRYASHAKKITNKPRVNEDPKDARLKEYEEEIKRLKELITNLNQGVSINPEALIGAFAQHRESIEQPLSIGSPSTLQQNMTTIESNSGDPGSERITKEMLALQQERELLSLDKERYQNELKEKEMQVMSEREQKMKLEAMLKSLEQRLVVGGQTHEGDFDKEKAHREFQLKLKKQRKKEKKLLEEKMKKEEEALLADVNYKNLQEEVEDMRKVIKKLRVKYKGALNEISDLAKEHELNREDMLDTIREQEKDVNFYYKVATMIFHEDEMNKIRAKSNYDEEQKAWKVPPFIVKNKKVKLPQLKPAQAMTLVENEKDNRDLEFLEDSQPESTLKYSRLSNEMTHSQNLKDKNNSNANSISNMRIASVGPQPSNYGDKSGSYMMPESRKNKYLHEHSAHSQPHGYASNQGSGGSASHFAEKKTKNQKAQVHLQPLSKNPAVGIQPVNIEDVKKNINGGGGGIRSPDSAKVQEPTNRNHKKLAPLGGGAMQQQTQQPQARMIGGSYKNLPPNGVEVSFKATFLFDQKKENHETLEESDDRYSQYSGGKNGMYIYNNGSHDIIDVDNH